jgi:phage terminase small subunit
MGKNMSNKNPKPAIFDIMTGNPSHYTKEALAEKIEKQWHIGGMEFVASDRLCADIEAKKMWDGLVKMIVDSGADFVTDFDSSAFEDYCLQSAEKDRHEKAKQEIRKKLESSGLSEEAKFIYINELGLQDKINKLVESKIRLWRSLGFDPLSRLNAIKRKNEPKKDLKDKYEKEFGGSI